MNIYQWHKLKDKQKKKISSIRPIFILGSRDISSARIQELTEQLIKKRPVVWGCLTDQYIPGLKNSPQFETLTLKKLKQSLAELDTEASKINILQYDFRHVKYILRELKLSAVIGIYGSWHKAFHFTPIYFELNQKDLPYKLVSGFVDEKAAKNYAQELVQIEQSIDLPGGKLSDQELLALAAKVAHFSCDYTFQTGAVLAKENQVLATAYNRVIPYKTYSLHHGASKEKHFSPPQDLNYFDTNHAEVELLLKAAKRKIDLAESTLYINLLPCPTCARMVAQSPIKKIVYQHDHSQGYAFKLLSKVGKKVRRIAQV
jgi:dCMP deaminase